MFGLEDEKGDNKIFNFDMEKDLKNPDKTRKIKDDIHKRMLQIKSALREGESQEEFDRLGTLLLGYASLLKVVSRIEQKA